MYALLLLAYWAPEELPLQLASHPPVLAYKYSSGSYPQTSADLN